MPRHAHGADSRRERSCDAAENCGLAGSVRAAERDALPVGKLEIELPNHFAGAEAPRKAFDGQNRGLSLRLRCRSPFGCNPHP
jgi:hypothetical protein